MNGLVTLAHMSREAEIFFKLLGIAACVLAVLVLWGSLWLLRRIVKRQDPGAGIRHFGLRALLFATTVLAVAIGYNLAVMQTQVGMPPIYVCETQSATEALRSVKHSSVVSMADIRQVPASCRNHNVFAIPETFSNKEIIQKVEVLLVDVRPWVRMLRFPTSAEGRSVETWINDRKGKMNDIEISSAVWGLVSSQHPRPGEARYVDQIHGMLALLPPAAILLLAAFGGISGRALASWSAMLCLLALALPMWNDVWGFAALPACVLCVGALVYPDGRDLGLAASLGLAANLLFTAAYVAYWRMNRNPIGRLRFARVGSVIALACALAAIYPLSGVGGQMPIYMGYGVWVAGLLALAIGSWLIPNTGVSDVTVQPTTPIGQEYRSLATR